MAAASADVHTHWIDVRRVHLQPSHAPAAAMGADSADAAPLLAPLQGGDTIQRCPPGRRRARSSRSPRGPRGARSPRRPRAMTRRHGRNSVYYVTNDSGEPMRDARGAPRMYAAATPLAAAAKAFRAHIRSVAGRAAVCAAAAAATTPPQLPLQGPYAACAAAVRAGSVTEEAAARYMAAYTDMDAALLAYKATVHIVADGSATVRKYCVGYEPVARPNAHEIRKGVNKVACARYIPQGASAARAAARLMVPLVQG